MLKVQAVAAEYVGKEIIFMWIYKSQIGVMKIFQNQNRRYSLEINGTVYGSYHTPNAAAQDVYTHTTDCLQWDVLDGTIHNVPDSIIGWVKLK